MKKPLQVRLGLKARSLAYGLAGAGVVGLLLLAIGTSLDVLMRYAFAHPIRGFVDVIPLAGAVSLAACMPYAVTSRSHISVDILGQHVVPRWSHFLDILGHLLTVLVFAVMTWQLFAFAKEAMETGESMPILRWAIWPWWAAVTVFIGLTTLLGLATLGFDSKESAP